MLYSEYEELRKNFDSVFKNIHCELTHNNTFVIHECNNLINKLNNDISFQYESDAEEFEMGGYRERDEMVARLEKLRDIARKNRDSQLDPEDILPDIDTTINTISYEKVNIGDDTLQDIDTSINGFNHDGVSVDGTDVLKDIDTSINGFNNDDVKIDVNNELNTIDSLGVDLFNNTNNSLEIYTKTDINGNTFLPLRYNESFNVFFGVNGYKKCNMGKNQLGYFNESCDTLTTVTYNEHDGSVDVCDTLFNILEYCKNNKNTAEAIDNILNVKVNILSSLNYLRSIDDSFNEYSKFYYDCARMCDDLVSKIKSDEESKKNDNDVFEKLSNEGVLLPIVKVGDSKELRAFISTSKSVLVDDSADILDSTVFNINALLAKIRKFNDVYGVYNYIYIEIDNIYSGTLGEDHINKFNELIHLIKESYDTVERYSSDIDKYKYVYDYYIDYINGLITNIKNSNRDEQIKAALNDIGNVEVNDVVITDNTDFSLSDITDFSKSWYDDTADMNFFLKYFKFEDNRMLGPDDIYYTLVSDLLIEEEHYDPVESINSGTFSKGSAIAPDGTMLKYTHGELVTLTQREWINELGCGDIDNTESNKKSSLYNDIIVAQDRFSRIDNWKDCFPLNRNKEDLSEVPLLARCSFVEWGSNKRPIFFSGFTPSLDDNNRGLQDTSYYLKASYEKSGNYEFLYKNRIVLNGKGSAVKEQDEAIDREKKKEAIRQITNDKLNSLTKGKVQNIDGVMDLTGSVLKGIGSMSGKAGNTISKFFNKPKK